MSGTVEAVTLRSTRLRVVDGTVWHVPNGTILRVGNKSQQWARARARRQRRPTAPTRGRPGGDQGGRRRGLAGSDELAGKVLEEPEVWGVEKLGPDGVAIRLVVKTLPAAAVRRPPGAPRPHQDGARRGRRGDPPPRSARSGLRQAGTTRTSTQPAEAASASGARVDRRPAKSRPRRPRLEIRDHAGGARRRRRPATAAQALGRVGDDDPLDVDPHRALGLGLGPAHLGEDVGGDARGRPGRPSPAAVRERLGVGPGRAVDRCRPATTTRPPRWRRAGTGRRA